VTDKEIRSGETPTGQKQADEAQQESDRRYRLLFENLITGFALHEMVYDEDENPVDYRFLDVNPAFEQLTGLPAASILGRTVLEVLPETEQRWIDTYAKVVQTGTPIIFEDYSRAVGKWFETRAFRTGRNQFATIFADVTERKRAEMGLRESEERFRTIFDQAAVGVALLNTKTGRFVRINQKYCDFLGYTMHEMLQKTFEDVTLSEDVQQNVKGNEQLMEGSIRAFSYEKRYVRKDGSLAWGSLTISPLWKPGEKPATYLHIAIVEDITERKQAEQALAYSQATLLEAQAIAHIGDWSLGAATRTFVWSDEMYVIHGIQPGTAVSNETYLGLIHPDDRHHVFEAMQSAMAGKQQEFVVDYRIVRPDGTERFVSMTGKTVLDSSGRVMGLRGTTQDITDRKRAEEEKEAMQAQLVQSKKLEAVGQLAGGVAHNFNNLLTGILGYIDIAQSDLDPSHPAYTSLNTARTACLRAASLARQLLSFSRNAMLLPTMQHASAAVKSALDLVCSSLPGSIAVVQDLNPDAWDVLVDSSQLTQVLLELANNAREAMNDQGTITVSTRNAMVDDAYVTTAPFARTGEFVVISVADTGPGIDPAMVPRLFEPFATTKLFGRGMGLATIFGALRQAGGWVSAGSEPNAGARIDLYLPRHLEEPPPSV
jgi:two-component system cell cycle sensor histidine kinase/response regulator CckA